QRIGRERVHHGLHVVEFAAAVFQRERHRFAHQLRIVGIVAPRLERGLADADDSDSRRFHWRPITTTVLYCIANPLAACASTRSAFGTWWSPARPRTWFAASAMRMRPLQYTGLNDSAPPERLTGSLPPRSKRPLCVARSQSLRSHRPSPS